MFNKTSLIKKPRLINNSKGKFRQTLKIKRDSINKKNSFDNYNKNDYSSENSNMNIKTTTQSKLVSETSSYLPIQTHPNYKVKKNPNFFQEEKEDKNKTIKTHYSNQSAKNHKKFGFNTMYDLKNNNKFYFGKKIKNEIIQCQPDNNLFMNEFRNLLIKDKKIDRMAKKLILKLNEDEYYDSNKTFKNLFGNNITLKNGFFNGVNLVMNKQDEEKEESKNRNNKNNIKNIKQNESNNDSTNENISNQKLLKLNPNSNLPLYLREKANIQGTEILSPFCKEARDEYLFNKIFNAKFNRQMPKRFEIINNKFNIFYAENENQYSKKMKKLNNKLRLKGKKYFHQIGPTKDQIKLDRIKSTLSFIKKIFDYSYPNMILSKVRKTGKYHEKRSLTENNIPPYKKAELLEKKRNYILGKYLKMSIDVKKTQI